MSEYGYNVLETVANATNSDLILFFVICAVVAVPFYVASSRRRKQDKTHEIEREKLLLEVVKENTAVISGLKVTLDSSKVDTKDTMTRIHERIDDLNGKVGDLTVDIARIDTKMDKSLTNDIEIASKVNKTLLIVDAMPHGSNFSANADFGKGENNANS